TGVTCGTSPGNRAIYPWLTSDGTNLLATFLEAEAQTGTCCANNAGFHRSSLGVLAAGDLSKPIDLTFNVDASSACDPATPNTRIGAPVSSWIPSSFQYVVTWSDSHAGNGPHALVTTVSQTGTLGGTHTVTADEAQSALNGASSMNVISAASGTRVFVA